MARKRISSRSPTNRLPIDVTFPPKKTLRDLWSGELAPERVTAGVRASADRLLKELGGAEHAQGWRRIERRRAAALGRLKAITRYASGGQCRRRTLVGYFGERLEECSGCDVCDGDEKSRFGAWLGRIVTLSPRQRAKGA